ncbi:MAG: metal ABC transporter ATP-binding protein [Caldisericaceae bacterium]
MNNNEILTVKNLNVFLGNSQILHDINFFIKAGELSVIIGPNGAGKTTLLKAILGLIPYKGEITIFGKDLSKLTKNERDKIAYVPQFFERPYSIPITVNEFLTLSLQDNTNASKRILEFAKIGGIEKFLNKKIFGLSGGEMQRVLIVRALLSKPSLLLFDEPFSGVDKVGEKAFSDFILSLKKNYNVTAIMVSHDVYNVTKIVDKVICINKRLVCFGAPEEILLEEHFEEIFGKTFVSHKHKICKEGGPCKFYEDDESSVG